MKKFVALLLACCMLFALSACGKAKDRDIKKEHEDLVTRETEMPTASQQPEDVSPSDAPSGDDSGKKEEPLPTATSEDVELYVVNGGTPAAYVVNAYGQTAARYSVDTSGNIIDLNNKVIVAAANVSDFRFVTSLSFGANVYNATLVAKEETSATDPNTKVVKQTPVNVTVLISAGPVDATNGIIVVGTTNQSIAEIRPNNNAKIIANGAFELSNGEIAIQVSESGTARIEVTAKSEGEVKITARPIAGNSSAECKIVVKNGEEPEPTPTPEVEEPSGFINASGDPTKHVHEYEKTVVAPTAYEKGYTLYTCECGHSYKDNFVPPVGPEPTPQPTPHVHHYTSSVVAPTETERGYTLHVCECGDSYKDCFVDPTGKP